MLSIELTLVRCRIEITTATSPKKKMKSQIYFLTMRNSHNQRMQRAGVDDDVAASAVPAIVIFKIISICIESNNMLLVMWTRWRVCLCM